MAYAFTHTLPSDLDGDFSLSVWVKGITFSASSVMLFKIGALEVSLIDNGSSSYSIKVLDSNGSGTYDLSWDNSDWALITIVRDGTDILVYEDGELLDTYASGSAVDFADEMSVLAADGSIADTRVYESALSADAVEYLYDDAIDRDGDQTMPTF